MILEEICGWQIYVDVLQRDYSLSCCADHKLRGHPWLRLSSIGLGTYLGPADRETSEAVTSAAVISLTKGWNVLDTAANYR